MNDKEFEERWNKAVKTAQEKASKDESIKALTKKAKGYERRLGKIQGEIVVRSQRIFYEELKKNLQPP